MNVKVIQCPRCGNIVPKSQKFCSYCGIPFTAEIKKRCAAGKQPKPKRVSLYGNKKWQIAFFTTAGVFLCFTIIMADQIHSLTVKIEDYEALMGNLEEQSAQVELEDFVGGGGATERQSATSETEIGDGQTALAQTKSPGDFRSVNWGMEPEEVQSIETAEFLEAEDDLYYYKTEVSSIPVNLIYTFEDNRLVQGRYAFEFRHASKDDYLEDFNKLISAYSSQYGEPVSRQKVWMRDVYRNDPDQLSFAVSIGDVRLVTKWETENTSIALAMVGESLDIQILSIHTDINTGNFEQLTAEL